MMFSIEINALYGILSCISVVTICLCNQVVDKVKMQMDSFLEDGSIELKIKQFGRGNLIIIKASELFEKENLLCSLNPYDIAKISFIAFGEYFYKFPNEEKEIIFKKLLSKFKKEDF